VGWITHLSETLNAGILPSGFYALPEQHGGRLIADILTLRAPLPNRAHILDEGGVAVMEAPPKVRRKLASSPMSRAGRRTVTIRHVSGHQMIALIEIVSPANKDRASHLAEFVEKVTAVLWQGIHVLMIDLFPPGNHDPQGVHAAIWEQLDDEAYRLPAGEPLTLASYVGGLLPEAYIEHLQIGVPLLDMPLFLSPDRYVNVPLESTYQAAFQGLPEYWRNEVATGTAGGSG
jgi:hypothetical protein